MMIQPEQKAFLTEEEDERLPFQDKQRLTRARVTAGESPKRDPEELKKRIESLDHWDHPQRNIIKQLREKVLGFIAQKKPAKATEVIVDYLDEYTQFYAIRDDKSTELWAYYSGIYVPHGSTYIKNLCRNVLSEFYSTHFANAVAEKVMADNYVEQKSFFSMSNIKENLELVPIQNGLLNLRTKCLEPFTPEKVFFNKLPITYDDIQTYSCDNFLKFLKDIVANLQDIQVIQEMFGYCLYRENLLEKSFMLTGEGRNGKSKLLEILKLMLGHDNCSSVMLQDLCEESFGLQTVVGKYCNLAADIPARGLENTSVFKSLVGRDLLSVNRKFLPRIDVQFYAKLISSCNQLPPSTDLSAAFFQRWVLLEFPNKFLPQKELDALDPLLNPVERARYKLQNPNIIDELIPELSGILSWAIDGLQRLLKNKSFSTSLTAKGIQELWNRKANSFQAFADEYLSFDYGSNISKQTLRTQYKLFCLQNKVSVQSDKLIHDFLKQQGVSERQDYSRENVIRVWEGVSKKGLWTEVIS